MKKLKFDREAVRKLLLERYDLNERTVDLMLIRTKFLVRNKLFIKDVENLKKRKKDSDSYRNQKHKLHKKWCIDDYALYNKMVDPDPIVITGRDMEAAPILDQYHVDLRVDLRYPKNKILDTIKSEVDKWYDEFWRRMKEGLFYSEEIKEAKEPPRRLTGNILSDLMDYDRYIKVWDLRELEGEFPSEIEKKLDISPDTVKNWYRRACDLIKTGIPGFPPFPQK